ncbi:Peptide transporter family 1 [Astathelohania contejeani]|uniref:Peptide transporter family 1 n=1 Tax=Astathelohania contejeani TaxID=164912 RepID=A0ABQ7HZ79_9MICR|nr:Peptide transporter family 1 [Thelohania contejeani]
MEIRRKYCIALILGNKFFERLCYNGIISILSDFLETVYNFKKEESKTLWHIFTCIGYSFPFIGALFSDTIWGRYKTITYFSIVYSIGLVGLVHFSYHVNIVLLYLSLFLIALGSSAIKPIVSIFGGDQFRPEETEELDKFFSIFYLSTDISTLIAQLLFPIIPKYQLLCKNNGYPSAFIIAAFCFILSLILFVSGSKIYVKLKSKKDFYYKL